MSRRIAVLLVPFLAVASGCRGDGPGDGAVRAVISWTGFAPGCVRLVARSDGGVTQVSDHTDLAGARAGQRVVAIYRAQDWGPDVQLTAQGFEGSCAGGKIVATHEEAVRITNEVFEVAFPLAAKDADQDGFVAAAGGQPGTDCADDDANRKPGATEVCNTLDDDCDGAIDEGVKKQVYADGDMDGFGGGTLLEGCEGAIPAGYVEAGGDCDDANPFAKPGLMEACDGVDNDCDDAIDQGLPMNTYYADLDADTHGDPNAPITACTLGPNMATSKDDCDDARAEAFPGAAETCNMLDDDCDAAIDDGVQLTFFLDADSDGYGGTATQLACAPPGGYVAQSGDCDDATAAVRPNAMETCNQVDDDCDLQIDDGVTTTFFQDADADGYGTVNSTQQACTVPAGFSAIAGDCNDAANGVHPMSTEVCNTIDDDCDTLIDEQVLLTFYQDLDGDTYGNPGTLQTGCFAPMGYVTTSDDCNDANANINPGKMEVCNQLDDNCNQVTDEGLTSAHFPDSDGDGFGDASAMGVQKCPGATGFVPDGTDCDDGNVFRSPLRAEVCDGLDNDCNGVVDGTTLCAAYSWKVPANTTSGGNLYYRRLAIVNGGAWAVGGAAQRFMQDNNTTTYNFDGHCTSTLSSVTADFQSGEALYGGLNQLGRHTKVSGSSCAEDFNPPDFYLYNGMAYLAESSGSAAYAVTDGGRVFRWKAANDAATVNPVELANIPGTYFDLDGTNSAGPAYAVGGATGATVIRATSPTSWATDAIATMGVPAGGVLRSVSVSPFGGYAAAVGDYGIVLVRDPAGSQWTALSAPPGASTAQLGLLSVKTFGRNLIYVCGTKSGGGFGCWRWTGAWTTLSSPVFGAAQAPRDIDGVAPNNLWIAGDNDLLLHWSP